MWILFVLRSRTQNTLTCVILLATVRSIHNKIVMSQKMILLFGALILVGAGCTQSQDVPSEPSPVSATEEVVEEQVVITEEESVADVEESVADESLVTWSMSKEYILFQTPGTWKVAQYDAGGVSSVVLQDESGADVVYISIASPGDPTPFVEWLSDRPAIEGFQHIEAGEIIKDDVYYQIRAPEEVTDAIQAVIDSVVINPTEEELSQSQVIH